MDYIDLIIKSKKIECRIDEIEVKKGTVCYKYNVRVIHDTNSPWMDKDITDVTIKVQGHETGMKIELVQVTGK